VLLLYPPAVFSHDALTGTNRPVIFPTLGILSIAGKLREAGHEVILQDSRLSAVISPFGESQRLFGIPVEQAAEAAVEAQPDLIGISNNFPLDQPVIEALAGELKRRMPSVPIVVGGHTATNLAQVYIANPNIDFVIKGEGEDKIFIVIDRIQNGPRPIGGIIDGSEAEIPYFIQDLDTIPFPAYDLVDMERYFYLQSHGHSPRTREYGRRAMTIFTSRGCPWECGFCSIHAVMGYRFRAHSPKYVVDHIKMLYDRYRIDYLHVEDDNFTLKKRRFDEILDGIIAMKPQFKWDTPNGVRADMLTRDLVFKSKKAGCKYFVVGVESGDETVLNSLILKRLDLNAVRQAAQWCKEARLELQAFFIFGYPGETLEQMQTTRELAMELYQKYDVYPNMSIVTPLTGTRVYSESIEKGYLVTYKGAPRLHTPEFTPQQVDELVISMRKEMLRIFLKKLIKRPLSSWDYLRIVARNPAVLKKLIPKVARARLIFSR